MTTKQIPVWIDCDTGTDDSVAIMLAHALPELSVVALSAVAGNSPLYNTFPNTRRIVHLLGADYPVYPGAERPLVREPHVAGKFHGENGLGDVELPLPDCAPETTPAWDALYEAAKRMPGELRLVATGPLTNVAIALTKYPELKTLLHSIALMGGAAVGGNVTPAAEFNILADADAAHVVFTCNRPITMVGLDVTRKVLCYPSVIERMEKIGTPPAMLFADLMRFFSKSQKAVFGWEGGPLHDPLTIAYLIDPTVLTTKAMFTEIDIRSVQSYGRTNCDFFGYFKKEPNSNVAVEVDVEKFWDIIEQGIRNYG